MGQVGSKIEHEPIGLRRAQSSRALELLHSEPALILNSRQTKTPVGSDPWVKATIDACRSAISEGSPIIASIGMNTWELCLWAIGEHNGKGIVMIPEDERIDLERKARAIADDFGLDFDRHAWIPTPSAGRGRKSWWESRDSLAFELASTIYPISIRSGGGLDRRLSSIEPDLKINRAFQVKYQSRARPNPAIEVPHSCFSTSGWPYLTHWTCRHYGPWPGEKSADFYRDLVGSNGDYPRSALSTLKRILSENLLRGSSNHIRENNCVVAFTSLQPSQAIELMRWRSRYVRPTFEPFGVAIHARIADALGIRPVEYVGPNEKPESHDPKFLQGYGTGDWPAEAEWRAAGDIDLSRLSEDDAVVLVPSQGHALEIEKVTRFPVFALSGPGPDV
jgi:hypothetical protein